MIPEHQWSIAGQQWVETLSHDQKEALKAFFGRTPDEALHRVRLRRLPALLHKETVRGYLHHVAEPAIRAGKDGARYILQGRHLVGMQKFRKQLIDEVIGYLK